MSEIDFSKFKDVRQIFKDIQSVKIQGATNVAIATFEGVKLFLQSGVLESLSGSEIVSRVIDKASYLALARENEPLAKNGVKYLQYKIGLAGSDKSAKQLIDVCMQASEEYLDLIKQTKSAIIDHSDEVFKEYERLHAEHVNGILTHCHSSTAESIIINYAKEHPSVKVVCTETRPLYQGRITAKNLVQAGVNTTMIVDSSAASAIMDKGNFNVAMVFIGADQITKEGSAINKVGSWGIALASYADSDPIYVVTPLLKIDIGSSDSNVVIEMREGDEVWEEAPEGLKLLNPAFDLIIHRFISGYITEFGLIKPENILETVREHYGWVF